MIADLDPYAAPDPYKVPANPFHPQCKVIDLGRVSHRIVRLAHTGRKAEADQLAHALAAVLMPPMQDAG